MGKIGIIKESEIEEIVFKEDMPKLIFGLSNAPAQKKERKSIGHALAKTGLEVYATDTLWPNDSYVSNKGLVIAERHFRDLAHGGNYIFGDGFVLVSSAIKDNLEERLKDSEHFRKFFSGSEVIFVPPYSGVIFGRDGFSERPRHIDKTIGYVPKARLLSIDEKHYEQEKAFIEELKRRFGVYINITNQDDPSSKNINEELREVDELTKAEKGMLDRLLEKFGPDSIITSHDNHLPNNFYVVQYNEDVFVIANGYNNPLKERESGFKVIETDKHILNLSQMGGGSVKCAANISPTTKLWDALGIEYRRWGVNPKQANYAMR